MGKAENIAKDERNVGGDGTTSGSIDLTAGGGGGDEAFRTVSYGFTTVQTGAAIDRGTIGSLVGDGYGFFDSICFVSEILLLTSGFLFSGDFFFSVFRLDFFGGKYSPTSGSESEHVSHVQSLSSGQL